MIQPKQGELWIMKEESFERRPVVVISKKNYLVAEIVYSSEVESKFKYKFDWLRAGLRRKSEIKLNKIHAMERTDFQRKIGRISNKDLEGLVSKCKSLIFGEVS